MIENTTRKPKILYFAIALSFVGLVLYTLAQTYKERLPQTSPSDRETQIIPAPEWVRWTALGHHEALANLYWMKSLVYLGEHVMDGSEAPYLGRLVQATITLDSLNHPAYALTGAVIHTPDSVDVHILKQGLHFYPDDWKLALHLSFRQIDKYHNFKEASQTLLALKSQKNVPEFVTGLGGILERYGMPIEISIGSALQEYATSPPLFRKPIVSQITRILFSSQNPLRAPENPAQKAQVQAILNKMDNGLFTPGQARDALIALQAKRP